MSLYQILTSRVVIGVARPPALRRFLQRRSQCEISRSTASTAVHALPDRRLFAPKKQPACQSPNLPGFDDRFSGRLLRSSSQPRSCHFFPKRRPYARQSSLPFRPFRACMATAMSARLHACANPTTCGWSDRRLSHRGVAFSLRVMPPFSSRLRSKPTL